MVNLLQKQTVEELRRAYFVRAATVTLSLLSAVLFLASIPLMPIFISTRSEEVELLASLSTVRERAELLAQQTSATTSLVVAEQVQLGIAVERSPIAERAVAVLLRYTVGGVTLSSLHVKMDDARSVTVSAKGSAPSRDALSAFESGLRTATGVQNVKVPVSAFVEERDRDFTVVFQYSLPSL